MEKEWEMVPANVMNCTQYCPWSKTEGKEKAPCHGISVLLILVLCKSAVETWIVNCDWLNEVVCLEWIKGSNVRLGVVGWRNLLPGHSG